jgi:hypothetical protein
VLEHDRHGGPGRAEPDEVFAVSGLPLALAGLEFVLKFCRPLPGPHLANDSYPLGPYVNTWAVLFGFMWLAYGLAFLALAILTPRNA